MIIAVDGPAAAGKGTLVSKLAKHFNLESLDTGTLYRGVALSMINQGIDLDDERTALQHAIDLDLRLTKSSNIRSAAVGVAASKIASIKTVRTALLNFQREFAANPPDGKEGTILDGRDVATVVCPEADYKIFVTANIEIRTKRRLKELIERNEPAIYEQIMNELRERDDRDTSRSIAPLRQASGAMVIDTSGLDAEQAFDQARVFIASKKL
jgi:cytidylate kinase